MTLLTQQAYAAPVTLRLTMVGTLKEAGICLNG